MSDAPKKAEGISQLQAVLIVLGTLTVGVLLVLPSCLETTSREAYERSLCFERVCRPTWASNCTCNMDQWVEILPNGDVVCRCPRAGGPTPPTRPKEVP